MWQCGNISTSRKRLQGGQLARSCYPLVEVLDALVVVVAGALLDHVLGADFLAEGEVAVGYVDVVVIVYCGGADVLV